LPDPDSAVLDVRPAHREDVADPLARANAQFHDKAFSGAKGAMCPVDVEKLARPRLALCLGRFDFRYAPRRVGFAPAQVYAVFHENTQHAERVVGEIGFLGVCIAEADHVLALHLGRVCLAHNLAEEIEIFVVVQTRARFEVLVSRRFSIVVDQSAEIARDHFAGRVLLREDASVFGPEFRRSKFVLELLRGPAAPLEVNSIALPVDVLWKLTFCHGACLSCRNHRNHALWKEQSQSFFLPR